MPITKKKYIEIDNDGYPVAGRPVVNDDDGGLAFPISRSVELPDLSNATDLEKLEWVLKEIGAGRKLENALASNPDMGGRRIFCLGFVFNHEGKLIK